MAVLLFANTTNQSSLTPNQIADAIGKSVTEVNQSMSRLTNQSLLQYRTIELDGEIEVLLMRLLPSNAWMTCFRVGQMRLSVGKTSRQRMNWLIWSKHLS